MMQHTPSAPLRNRGQVSSNRIQSIVNNRKHPLSSYEPGCSNSDINEADTDGIKDRGLRSLVSSTRKIDTNTNKQNRKFSFSNYALEDMTIPERRCKMQPDKRREFLTASQMKTDVLTTPGSDTEEESAIDRAQLMSKPNHLRHDNLIHIANEDIHVSQIANKTALPDIASSNTTFASTDARNQYQRISSLEGRCSDLMGSNKKLLVRIQQLEERDLENEKNIKVLRQNCMDEVSRGNNLNATIKSLSNLLLGLRAQLKDSNGDRDTTLSWQSRYHHAQKELQVAKEREIKSEDCLAKRLQLWREEKRHLLDLVQSKHHRSTLRDVNDAIDASAEIGEAWSEERSKLQEQVESLTSSVKTLDSQLQLQKQRIEELLSEKMKHQEMLRVFEEMELNSMDVVPIISAPVDEVDYQQIRSSELLRLVKREVEAVESAKTISLLEDTAQKLRVENESLKERYENDQKERMNLSSDTTVRMLQLSRQNGLYDEVYAVLCEEKHLLQERCDQLEQRLNEKGENELITKKI
uniref:AlNc14C121G6686 protein n=1 Tax=Albugo laibachii Nc14 TaxID=890382 RepID=F0WJF7_9STRA|nr:AlNc14C121G6686 [Albugo laibachii Nc14]|eukprot:CCA21406.1 AlNc14C121G6686 [Albugo laibachii Nc14]